MQLLVGRITWPTICGVLGMMRPKEDGRLSGFVKRPHVEVKAAAGTEDREPLHPLGVVFDRLVIL